VLFDRITSDPAVLDGQPHIRGTRLTVRRIMEALVVHRSCLPLFAEHPGLDPDDLRAAVEFGAMYPEPAVQ
jgi:uncharacterized protein (DUF433 family)